MGGYPHFMGRVRIAADQVIAKYPGGTQLKRNEHGWSHTKACIGVLAFIAGAVALVGSGTTEARPPASAANRTDTPQDASTAAPSLRQATRLAKTAVVAIETLAGPCTTPAWEARQLTQASVQQHDAAGFIDLGRQRGSGSGFVIDRKGYVVTCAHVVAGSDAVHVRLNDGRRLCVQEVVADPLTDVAVLKVAPWDGIVEANAGDVSELNVGDSILTIGHPYGIGLSISAGIVSAKNRTLDGSPYLPLIQTDAASNPGNSGGPIVDLQGRVVGMSEGGYGISSGFQGIGFAVPIDLVMQTARRLINDGEVVRPYFGVSTEIVSPDLAGHLGIANGGVIVSDVEADGPAEVGGIEVGDVITRMQGFPIQDNVDFFQVSEGIQRGTDVAFNLLRKGQAEVVHVVPTSLDVASLLVEEAADNLTANDGYVVESLGVTVVTASSQVLSDLGLQGDRPMVVITNVAPHSIAATEGLCAGMAVLQVEDRIIESPEELDEVIKSQAARGTAMLLMAVGPRKHFVVVPLQRPDESESSR